MRTIDGCAFCCYALDVSVYTYLRRLKLQKQNSNVVVLLEEGDLFFSISQVLLGQIIVVLLFLPLVRFTKLLLKIFDFLLSLLVKKQELQEQFFFIQIDQKQCCPKDLGLYSQCWSIRSPRRDRGCGTSWRCRGLGDLLCRSWRCIRRSIRF